jgi:PAS domain S-box-containing protein
MLFKFRDQLLLTLLLVGLAPSILIAIETYYHNAEQVQGFSIESAQNKLSAIASNLSSELSEAEKYVALYARNPKIQSMQYDQFMPTLKSELFFLKPKYEKFIVGQTNGHFYNTSGANLLQGGIRTFDDKSAISKPKNIRKRDYWQQTTLNNLDQRPLTYISKPMISYTTGVKQVVIASSIINTNKELVGMIGLSIGWSRIESLIQSLIAEHFSLSEQQAQLMLISNDGTYWYHWQKEKVIQLVKDEDGRFVLNKNGEKAISKSLIINEEDANLRAIGKSMIAGQSGVETISSEDIKQYVIYQPIDGSSYSVALVIDNDIIMAPIYDAFRNYVVILIICLLLIFLIGSLFAKYFSNPIAELVSKISLLALGQKTDRKITTKTKELQVLSNSIFNLYEKINIQSETIQAGKERFHLIMQGSNDGIWDWNLVDKSLYLSPRWKGIIGFQDDELPTDLKVFQAHVHPDDKQLINNLFKHLFKGSELTHQVRFRMKHKSGGIIYVLTRCTIIRDDNQKALRVIGTNTDISDLVAREHEVTELNKDLEYKVIQRTQELEQAVVEAEEANQAKSSFLSNMSHEIRTPMNGIIGLTQICLSTELSDQQRDYLEKVMSSSKVLLRILNEILDFNKIESNMLELETSEVSLNDILEQVDALMRPAADEKGIKLALISPKKSHDTVRSDSVKLTQILLNLCGNAVKFTHEGNVEVKIKAVSDGSGSNSLKEQLFHFSVSDTGIGIKNKDHLFNPFKQEDASTTRKYGGTGLGLAISKRLVELMGGKLELDSEPGKGSCFSFNLSLLLVHPTVKETPLAKEGDQANNEKVKRDRRILIVEDNKINQIIAENMLKVENYTTCTVANGQQALDIVKQQAFDIILMDIQMPVMDGETAAKHLLNDPESKNIPIIAMTANVMTHEVQHYLKVGFSGFIGKPLMREDMLEEIDKLLS